MLYFKGQKSPKNFPQEKDRVFKENFKCPKSEKSSSGPGWARPEVEDMYSDVLEKTKRKMGRPLAPRPPRSTRGRGGLSWGRGDTWVVSTIPTLETQTFFPYSFSYLESWAQ